MENYKNPERGLLLMKLITSGNGLRLRRRSLAPRRNRGSGAQGIRRSSDQDGLAGGGSGGGGDVQFGALSAGQEHNITDSVRRKIIEHKNLAGVENRHLGCLRRRHSRFINPKTKKIPFNQTRNFSKTKTAENSVQSPPGIDVVWGTKSSLLREQIQRLGIRHFLRPVEEFRRRP